MSDVAGEEDIEELQPRQLLALDLLLAGTPTTSVAEALGVDRRTVNRWRSDPVFDEEFRRRQQEIADEVHAKLVSRCTAVADALANIALNVETFPVDEEREKADGEGIEIVTVDKRLNHPAMARVNAARVMFELLGRHKNSPVAASEKGADPETPEQLLELLLKVPVGLLEQAIEAKRGKAAKPAKPKPERTKPKAKDL